MPILGSVLAPHQGFFPKYAEGIICKEDTSMIVSRGLGDSLFPVRMSDFLNSCLLHCIKNNVVRFRNLCDQNVNKSSRKE